MKNLFHPLPKSDHHHHLFLGGHRRRMEELFGASLADFCLGTQAPRLQTFESAQPHHIMMQAGRLRSQVAIARMTAWIREEYMPLCGHEKFLEYAVTAALEAARDDNVRRLEASFNLTFAEYFHLSAADFLTVLRDTHQRVAPEMIFGCDLGISRTAPVDAQFTWLERFLEIKDDFDSPNFFISGVDLYDVEDISRDREFQKFFALAARHGLKRKAHVGEFSPAETVLAAVEMLELDEVQHGIHAGDSPETARRIARRGTRLNVSPASNEILGAADFSRKPHPLRVLHEEGVRISLATDDLLLFGKTITDQCVSLAEQEIFTPEEICEIIAGE